MSPETLFLVIVLPIVFYSFGKWLDSSEAEAAEHGASAKSFVAGTLGILMLGGLLWVLFIPNSVCKNACIKDFGFSYESNICDSRYDECPEQVWDR